MDSGSSCPCDSTDPSDPTEYLEALKKKYMERTVKLQAQQQALEKKIMKMEAFISKTDVPNHSMLSRCECDGTIPKVFPETPVRDVQQVPKTITDVIQNQQPISQPCSFFQKMMENAKSILSMKCQCPSPFASSKSTDGTTPAATTSDNTPATTTETTTGLTTETTTGITTEATTGSETPTATATASEPPTRENDISAHQSIVDCDNTLTDKTSGTSTCSCDLTDPSTLQEASCSCNLITDQKCKNNPQSQQVSMDPTSSVSKEETQDPHHTDPPTMSKSEKECPWKDPTSELVSGGCSCEVCKCDSSEIIDSDENMPSENLHVPTVAVFMDKSDNLCACAEVQVAATTKTKGILSEIPKDTASKCVTCCRNAACPLSKVGSGKGDALNAGVQVMSHTKNKGITHNISKNAFSMGVTCCKQKNCPANKGKKPLKRKSNPPTSLDRQAGPDWQLLGQNQDIQAKPFTICHGICNTDYWQNQARHDGENQCAFIGSPLLDSTDFETRGNNTIFPLPQIPCDSNTPHGTQTTGICQNSVFCLTSNEAMKAQTQEFQKRERQYSEIPCASNKPLGTQASRICENSVFSLTSNDIMDMQNIAELAKKEKEMKAQIEELQKRERQYAEVTRNVENLVNETSNPCCCGQRNNMPGNMNSEIEKISRELRLENQMLKSELLDMKVELKHCLEKVEGPMKHKLLTEKQKCECLQRELQEASKSMLINQEATAREMNQLKLQLCCACTNITELNQMNQRLKDEMAQLDCLCQKLEDDLIKQKVNEAETIKRLTSRKYSGDVAFTAKSEDFRCESNLDVIARRLSNTIKDLGPCEECSKLPAELAGAAKCIKDLTDMVRKHKMKSQTTSGCGCQSKPSKPSTSKPSTKSVYEEEECCTCCGPRDGGGEREEKTVKTLHQIPDSFVPKVESSKFNVPVAPSSYYSTKGEPVRDEPCGKSGIPCYQTKSVVTREEDIPTKVEEKPPCNKRGDPCKKDQPTPKDQLVQVPSRFDKSCSALRAKDGEVLTPEKDQEPKITEDESYFLAQEQPTDEKPIQVPEEIGQSEEIIMAQEAEGQPAPEGKLVQVPSKVCRAASGKSRSVLFPERDQDQPSPGAKLVQVPSKVCRTPSGKSRSDLSPEKDQDQPSPEAKLVQVPSKVCRAPCGKSRSQLTPEKGQDQPSPEAKLVQVPSKGCRAPCGKSRSQLTPEKDQDISTTGTLEARPTDTQDTLATADIPLSTSKLSITSSDKRHVSSIAQDIVDRMPETVSDSIQAAQLQSKPTLEEESSRDGVKELPRDDLGEPTVEQPVDMFEPKEHMGLDTVIEMSGESGAPLETSAPNLVEGIEDFDKDTGLKHIPFEEKRYGPQFPVDISTEAFGIVGSPELHVTTTVTASGVLEVITEGPGGTIETTLTYTEEGNIEVVTEMMDHSPDHKPLADDELEKFATTPIPREIYEQTPGSVLADPSMSYYESFDAEKPRIQAMPVASSAISGVSGPEIGTPYTPSEASDRELTSKLASGSSGVRPDFIRTPELTSGYGVSSALDHRTDIQGKTSERKLEQSEMGPVIEGREPPEELIGEQALDHKTSGTPIGLSRSAVAGVESVTKDITSESQPKLMEDTDVLLSEGTASTAEQLKSGEVFTPEQVISDLESPITSEKRQIEPGQKTSRTEGTVRYGPSGGALDRTDEGVPSPDTGPAGTRETRDCACQSKDQTDQSCQCCECKTVGVTTSGDKETITEKEAMGIQETIEEAKTDTDSEFLTISEATEHAVAQTSSIKRKGDVLAEPGTGPPTGVVVDDKMLEKHPELKGKTTAEQKQILMDLGYDMSKSRLDEGIKLKSKEVFEVTSSLLKTYPQLAGKTTEEQLSTLEALGYSVPKEITITEDLLENYPQLESLSREEMDIDDKLLKQHPELRGKSKQEQQIILRDMGYKPSRAIEGDIPLYDQILAHHPELVGKSKSEQQEILKSLGYQPPLLILVDSDMIQKHPELSGKSPEEQQNILKNLGYVPSISRYNVVDDEMLQSHPELSGKSLDQQKSILRSLGYVPSKGSQHIAVDDEMLQKYPELLGKSPEEQQSILKSMGYVPSKTSQYIDVDDDVLEKHPELSGKSPEAQQSHLRSLGYLPSKSSQRIAVDDKMLQKHPELLGKSPKEQQSILSNLGYVPSKTTQPIAVDDEMLQKHPELSGKSPKEQQSILRNLGYVPSKTTQPIAVDDEMLQKHPELSGKSPKEQQSILRNLGYVPSKTTQPIDVDDEMLQKHPELLGKSPKEQQSILKNLGYVPSKTTQPIAVDDEMLQKHPELSGKSLKEQQSILKNLGYVPSKTTQPIAVDDEMLQKHPELSGKSPKEQQSILKGLGYVPSKTTQPISVTDEMLQKHPELSGKSPKEQQSILRGLGYVPSSEVVKESRVKLPQPSGASVTEQESMVRQLGFSTPKIEISQEILERHPELAGKGSEEQQKVLSELGYVAPQVSVQIDPQVLELHPELIGKPLEEQAEMLVGMGYILDEILLHTVPDSVDGSKQVLPAKIGAKSSKSVAGSQQLLSAKLSAKSSKSVTISKFSTPEQSSKDVSVTCKAPCRTKAIPGGIPKPISQRSVVSCSASLRSVDKKKKSGISLSSKEASVTCKAPCKSVATIQSTTSKASEKYIGDSSRSISLQHRPSSRDDSASCRASCRTISVQMSKAKTCRSQKEIREIVAARTDSTTTTTTSSSSDVRQKEKGKSKDKLKKELGEVPPIVSELSDKEIPGPKPSRRSKSNRKRRSKVPDCLKCGCVGQCICNTCVRGQKKQALNRPVRSCDCSPGNMIMMDPMMMISAMQMSYSMPPTGHAANCRCNACLEYGTNTCKAPCSRVNLKKERPEAEWATSDETDSKKYKKHHPNCECVDCLCLPKIKKLANTKECPIVYDTKQVYQVKVKCDCSNAQTAKRIIEQNRSRIPISTTTSNPPKVKSDHKQNAEDQPKQAESANNPPLSNSESLYNSVACDCPECVCTDCPDGSKRAKSKDCCCKDSCICDPCVIEELARKLREAEAKLAASYTQPPTQPGGGAPQGEHDEECTCSECVCPQAHMLPGKGPQGEHDEECTCSECVCPQAHMLPGKGKDDEECTCVECVCPQADALKALKAGGAGGEECECKICECPGSTSLPPKQSGSEIPSCDCKECKCAPCADPKKEAIVSIADCDCVDCKCSPCADPKKRKDLQSKTVQKGEGDECACNTCECLNEVEVKEVGAGEDKHPEDCDCSSCVCPGAEKATATHGEECDCSSCVCPGGPPDTYDEECDCTTCTCPNGPGAKHDEDCTCSSCVCPGADKAIATKHDEDCTCSSCTCPGASDKALATKHDEDCTCSSCACPDETDKAVATKHDEDCTCSSCVCPGAGDEPGKPAEKEVHALSCACPECLCAECTTKSTHAPGCKCDECVCDECDLKVGEAGEDSEKVAKFTTKATHAPGCKCDECVCDESDLKVGEAGDQKPAHKTSCTCITCACDKCTDPSKQTGKPQTGVTGPHEDGCKCIDCICQECLMKLTPLQHDEGCKCAQCLCVECLKKMQQQGDQQTSAPSKAEDGKSPGCTCIQCICIDCTGIVRTEPAIITPKPSAGGKPGSGEHHSGECDCTICVCTDSTAASAQGDMSKDEPDCSCEICKCVTCTGKKEGDMNTSMCTCTVCDCGSEEPAPPAKPPTEAAGGLSLTDPPPFEPFKRIDCNCQKCGCIICKKDGKTVGSGPSHATFPDDYVPPPFEVPVRIDCICNRCSCIFCNKQGPAQKSVAAQPSIIGTVAGDTKAVSVQQSSAHSPGCTCERCQCHPCKPGTSEHAVSTVHSKQGVASGSSHAAHPDGCTCCSCKPCITGTNAQSFVSTKESNVGTAVKKEESSKSAMPIHCNCPTCTCDEGVIKCMMLDTTATSTAGASTAQSTQKVPSAKPSQKKHIPSTGPGIESVDTMVLPKPDIHRMYPEHLEGCDCGICTCDPCADPKSKSSVGGRAHPDGCTCDACICITCKSDVSPDVKGGGAHPDGCICDACVCVICKPDVKNMDNVALVKSIQEASKENCECKEQIEEIKRTLEKIKCACSEAEFRSTQSMAQTMGKDMSPIAGKPFVKKASNFGQTMSGLKMALNNLQSKCKAKDRMIEAMTNELSNRGAPEVFDKVLDQSVKICMPLDYDQAEDVKSLNRSQLTTNVIYPPIQRKDEAVDVCDVKNTASKGVEVRTHKHKKRKEKHTSAKNLDNCSCSKPQIIQREEKDCQKLDLTGFEVIDIRRITDDSIIVKWNAPKNDQVQGYDIFVNGTLATKVMSGTRTSAMMHSLDLTKSVQITIYAVTKCGRVEPPAIAIYEIKC